MKSKLIILGCGSSVGVPRIDNYWGNCKKNNKKNIRSRCSIIIQKGKNSILIDTSPDVKNQFISNKINNLTSVIYTHEHADQTNGLFELRPFFWKNKRKINIYGTSRTINLIKKRYDYCFNDLKGYPAIVKDNIIKKKFTLGSSSGKISFRSFTVKHGPINSTAYVFEKVAYIADCNDLTIVKKKELKNLKYLILDCLKIKKHPTHFSLEESLYIHKNLKPKKTILTNLHHDLDYNYLLKKLPHNVFPAYDGLKLYF